MARSRIVTGLEKLMSDLPKLMIQRSLAQDAQMKKLSMQATEGYLKEAANFTTVAQFDAAAASMMDELGPYGNDPTIAMAGNNAFKAMGRLRDNFVNKQEAVVSFNTNFAKAKELNMLDTTSGMQDVYNSISTTLEAKKQYFNSTEYSAYQKNIEKLGEMIKVKSLTNYLDDLSVGARDEYGQLIVKPGIQSGSSKLQMVNELSKVGMISNAAAMKQLLEISEDINAGTAGAIMNSGAKDMRILDRQLKDFSYDNLPKAYSSKLLMSFDALQFTEKELTSDNINYVRSNLEETLNNVIGGEGFLTDQFLQDLPGSGTLLEKLEAKIKQERKVNEDKPISEIIEDVIDVYGFDFGKEDADTIAQKSHFSKMMNLYMKTGSILEDIRVANTSNTVDTSISGYTNALVNYGAQEEEGRKRVKVSTLPIEFTPEKKSNISDLVPELEKGLQEAERISDESNVLDLIKVIEEQKQQQRAEEFSRIPVSEWDRVTPDQEKPKDTFNIAKSMPANWDVTDLVESINPPPKEKIVSQDTSQPYKPIARPKVTAKPLPSLGKFLAQDKSPEAIAERKEAERIADIRVSVPAQEPDQDDMSYIEAIDSKQLRKIGIWSDKNITRKLKNNAKEELKSSIKQLRSLKSSKANVLYKNGNVTEVANADMVAKELPRLQKLLKEFNNAGVNKISKSMLEYIYMLNASQYDGVDDFIASLSDGKIGVE